ncbi:MAG: sigma-70 family RNA polymerase sigma factor [Planctomycetaceae bacterium]|nr:sigma-70 family RNA polymerase sigma factor [Planctomycetaceae bacterium]
MGLRPPPLPAVPKITTSRCASRARTQRPCRLAVRMGPFRENFEVSVEPADTLLATMAGEMGSVGGGELTAELLAASADLERLARRLARDEAGAKDLLQEAWLAATRMPAPPRSGWRAWMAGTLRQIASTDRRGEGRRRDRERVAAREEAVADPTVRIERLELHTLLLAELRSLPEPYRSALVERWLENHTPSAIAERIGVPVRTVETRLARGLVLLRARLERRARGGRGLWLSGLVALLVPPRNALALTMLTQRRALVVLLLVGCFAGTWFALRGPLAPHAPLPGDAAPIVGLSGDTAGGALLPLSDSDELPSRRAADDATLADAEVSTPALRGRIVRTDGAPIGGADVHVRRVEASAGVDATLAPLAGQTARGSWASGTRTRTGHDGRFRLAGLESGFVELAVRAPGAVPIERALIGVGEQEVDLGDLMMFAGVELIGKVVDDSGRALAGVPIAVRAPHASRMNHREFAPWLPAGESGPDGLFHLRGVAPGPFEIATHSNTHPFASVQGDCAGAVCGDILLRVGPSLSIAGRVVGLEPEREVPLFLLAEAFPEGQGMGGVRSLEVERKRVPIGPDGRFELRGLLHDGLWELVLEEDRPKVENEWSIPSSAAVRVSAGDLDVKLEAPRATLFSARLTAAGNEVPRDATVQVHGNQGVSASVDLVPDENGIARAELFLPDDLGSALASIQLAGHTPIDVPFRLDPESRHVDLGTHTLHPLPTVEVEVRSSAGQPQPGVLVRAAHGTLRQPDPNLGAIVGRLPPAMSDPAATDGSGRARVTRLGGQSTTVWVEDSSHGSAWATLAAPTDAPEPLLELRLAAPPMSVLVREAGQPLAGAVVSVERRTAPAGAVLPYVTRPVSAVTDAGGRATFAALVGATYYVTLRPAAARHGIRFERRIRFAGDGEDVVLELPPSTWLEGRIAFGGVPLAGAAVFPKGEPIEGALVGATAPTSATTVDRHGRFRLDELAPGPVELRVEHPTLGLALPWSVVLATGANRLDLEVLPASLEGRAEDDLGQPIAETEVVVTSASSGLGTFGSHTRREVRRVTTDSEGRYSIPDLPPDVPLTVSSEGTHVPRDEPLTLRGGEARRGHVLVLTRTAAVRIAISPDLYGNRSYLLVSLKRTGHTSHHGTALRGDELPMTGLAPGPWQLLVRMDFAPPFATRTVELPPGGLVHVAIDGP